MLRRRAGMDLVRRDEPEVKADGCRLDAVGSRQLAQDPLDVNLHGPARHAEIGRDFLVGATPRDLGEHLAFAGCQWLWTTIDHIGFGTLGEGLDQPSGEQRINERLARDGALDRHGQQHRGLDDDGCADPDLASGDGIGNFVHQCLQTRGTLRCVGRLRAQDQRELERGDAGFSGREVAFVSTPGPNRGIATLRVDGGTWQTPDLYDAATQTKQVAWAASSGSGNHTLEVRVSGSGNPSATGARIDVDAFLVWQPAT